MYEAYKNQRRQRIKKGIALRKRLTKKEFEQAYYNTREAEYEGVVNPRTGSRITTQNFSRQLAANDMYVTKSQAEAIYRQMPKERRGMMDIRAIRASSDVHLLITDLIDNGYFKDGREVDAALGY